MVAAPAPPVGVVPGREYTVTINSSSGARSTQGFAARRVRVTGEVCGGRLPIIDLTDPNGETRKWPHVANILTVDGRATGAGPARAPLRAGDVVLVDPAHSGGSGRAVVTAVVDDAEFVRVRPLIGGVAMRVSRAHVTKTTIRKLGGRGGAIRKSRRRAHHSQ